LAATPRDMDDETGSERTCIVTRARLSPDEMIRFVAGPSGDIVPDLRRRLPGRGVWVTATAEAVSKAMKGGNFARSLKKPVSAPNSLAEDLDRLIEKDALQSLAMANKAGLVVAGAAKVEAQIGHGDVAALIHAQDGSADGIRKIGQAVSRKYGPNPDPLADPLPRIDFFASGQLDLALGRSNVIHAALRRGAASQAFLTRCGRLARYRGVFTSDTRAGRVRNDAASVEISGGKDD
jgi:predicted RNA-binding protein YlxR (DUF448 family)